MSSAVFAYAQFLDNSYQVKTVHIFPSQIEADGWNNASTLSFQNLDNYALYQEFNSINSATLNLSTGTLIEKEREQKKVDEANNSPSIGEENNATSSDSSESDNDEPEVTEPVADSSAATTTATSTDVEFDLVIPDEQTDADTNVTTSTEPLSEPEIETESDTAQSTTTVMKRAQSVFRLAVSAVTSAFDTATNTSAQSQTEQSDDSETDITSSTSTVEEETSSKNDAPVATTTEPEQVPEDEEEAVSPVATTSTSTSETPAPALENNEDTEAPVESETETEVTETTECTEDCKPYIITLRDFGFPLEESTEVTGAQLRMSFAAQKKSYRERIPMFEMRYSMDDGVTWSNGGAVVIDDEVSNGFNGGYYLFALPEVSGESDLESLQVELSYRDDPSILKGLFVESVWLELFTVEGSSEELTTDNFAKALLEDGYKGELLNGDKLQLPDGEIIDIQSTDENANETLIIKSDKADYVGLTKTTTYFSVTNESSRTDEFTLQTYFPKAIGEVNSIREYNQNTPKKVIIPEFRPFVYNCEAGWEFVGEVEASSLEELSQQLIIGDQSSTTQNQTDAENELPSTTTTTTPVAPGVIESVDTQDNETDSVEFDLPIKEDVVENESAQPASTNTTSTVFNRLPSLQRLLQSSTTTVQATSSDVVIEGEEDEDETVVNSYSCRNTNVVRECDSIEGDNTACRVENKKVAEHEVTQFAPGWSPVSVATGTMPKGNIFKRVAQFVGFGPDKKAIAEGFEVQSHSNNTYTIQPGETKYFEMEISFPPFSSGEYWIEAVGDREYGLLDPFWSSQWRYKKPITVDNLLGATSTEQQIFLELDSTETDFWGNVQDDGGDIRFLAEKTGDSDLTWFGQNWQSRLPINITASTINADLTDFPLYINLADLGAEFFDNVKIDGSDIRVTASDGITELPVDLVSIDTSANTGELHFKADTVSSVTDNTFYIYYENGAASAYAASDTYGSQNVWTNGYLGVFHLEEDIAGTGNAGAYIDSTANGYNGDDQMVSTGKSGRLGKGQEFEQTANEYIDIPEALLDGEGDVTTSYWLRTTKTGQQAIVSAPNSSNNNEYLIFQNNQTTLAQYSNSQTTSFGTVGMADNTWRHYMVTLDDAADGGGADEARLYINGVADNENPKSINTGTLLIQSLYLGQEQDSVNDCCNATQALDGFLDEIRFASEIRTEPWSNAEFENQNDSTTFYSTSTPESFTPTIFIELDYWTQHFNYSGQEADIWVQLDELPGGATTTVYMYYGNPTSDTTSDEYAPFTYSTTTDLYYVVNDIQTNPIVVYSLIDGNEVSIDGGTSVPLNSGETTSFATYSSSSVISALGPITARTSDNDSENVVPISFASTTFANPSNRGSETYYTYAPFADADVSIYNGNSGTPSITGTTINGSAQEYAVSITQAGILEATEPVLFYSRNTSGDSLVTYPPTTRPLFGIQSSQNYYTSIIAGSDIGIYCSSGASATNTSVARGSLEGNNICTGASAGTGNAVMVVPTTAPVAAIQQADGGGAESSTYLPTPEFGTRYIVPQDANYISVACSPRFGTSTIEVRTAADVLVVAGDCNAGGDTPGMVNFNAGGPFTQGYQIVSTNNVPFYTYYEDDAGGNESSNWSAVQGKKYNSLFLTSTIGAEEENEDAQYEQLNYRWYENTNAITPTTPWDIDGTPVAEGAAISDQGAVNPGDELRLRMNLMANNGTGTVDSAAFILQYAQAEICGSVTENSWQEVAQVGSTTAVFAGFNNAAVGDGTELSSVLLSNSTVIGTYEEANTSATIPNEIANGEVIEFDWALTPVNTEANSAYCFRMMRTTGQVFPTYTTFPQVLTAGPPEVPVASKRFDNEHASSAQPTLLFAAVDQGADELDYQVQISTDNTFGTTFLDRRSDVNLFDFENVNNNSDKSPFSNGEQIEFTPQTALTDGETYWWRVRATDPGGSNSFGGWTQPQSFTINTAVIVSEWFQTTDEQFQTNSLTGAITSGNDSIELAIAGSNLIGEYGTIAMSNGATSTVTLNNSYTNPVVVASIRYARSVPNDDQPAARVSAKTSTTFDIYTDNYNRTAPGTSVVDYVVIEAGDYLIDDGAGGLRVFATSTSVSAYDGSTIASNPGGAIITFPTSFSTAPVVLSMVTTVNDPDWVLSTVYDGNNIANPPNASQVSVFLNDNLASDGHGAAEDIDVVAFGVGEGSNNGSNFSVGTTGVVVDENPYTYTFPTAFSSAPGVTVVSQHTTNGAQGGYAMVDTDSPATASGVTVAIEEGGPADRNHATEDVGIVAFAGSSGDILRAGTARVVSTAIDFDDADVGNAWGEVSWNDTGDVTYQVEYQTGSGFQLIPDSALSGNGAGFTNSPINILGLDTEVYNELRLVADLAGVDPEIFDWTVKWGQRVEIPTLGDPFDNAKIVDTTPTFDFFSTDPQGDLLEYEISYSTDSTFQSSSTTVDSSVDATNFNGGSVGPYSSGDTVTYVIPGASPLTNGETYWWRVRAKDPAGANQFSPWSEADNFTVDTATVLSTWFQTTQAQFTQGEIDGVIASTSDSVIVTNQVGEYGTTTVTANTWMTVNTELTYENMVVVASPEYAHDGSTNGRTAQIRNKTANSFEIRAENDSESLGGATVLHFLAIESGDWLLADGGAGTRMLAGTAQDVSNVESASYDGVGGTTINFTPAFDAAPEAILTISSANNSKWTGTAVSADGNEANEITANSMDVSMGISRDIDTVRDPEDIDYVVFDTGFGSNNGVLFDALRGTNISVSGTSVNYNQTFSNAPGVTLVHNNGTNGADGAFAQKETSITSTNSLLGVSIAELGDAAGNHNGEDVSILAFEADAGALVRDSSVSGGLAGTIGSEPILFSDGVGPKFSQAIISATTPGNSTTSIQVQYQTATGSWALIPDAQIPNNSVGNTGAIVNLASVNVVTYPVIRLLATLKCDATDCPTLDDWTVEWSEGVTMSGTLKEYDRLTNVATGTVTVSVNGGPAVRTGVVSAGVWSISNVTAFAGDAVTVFVSDVPDEMEAVAVFKYDGLGDMTGVEMFEQHLSLSADETATTSIASLGQSDNGLIGDEDVFFDVDFAGNLSVCAIGGCDSANLYIGAGNVFIPNDTDTKNIYTHDFINDGRVEFDVNNVFVSGSWDDNAQVVPNTSHVIFTGSEGGWYSDDWAKRLPITIDSSAVDAALTDFPVYVNLGDLPTSFFSDVKADGGDIRVTLSDGVTEVPFELVTINTGGKRGQLHFKAPRVSDSVDSVFFLYFDNPSASGYSVIDTFGRNNVWTNYEAVWHLNSPTVVDSTGNPRVPTNVGVTASTIGNRDVLRFNGSSYLNFGNEVNMGLQDLSFSVFVESTDTSASYVAKSYYSAQDSRYALIYNSGDLISLFDAGSDNRNNDYTSNFNNGTFRQAAITMDRDAVSSLYSDGVLRLSRSIATYSGFDFNSTNNLYVGTYNSSAGNTHQPLLNFTGKMAELKFIRTVLTPEWLAAENTNHTNSTGFYSVGTVTSPGAPAPASLEYLSGPLNFYDLSFNDAAGGSVWETLNNVVVNDDLMVAQGTLNRATSTLNIKGDLVTGTNGFWRGVGTTTFAGGGAAGWIDANPISQNIGHAVIDGAVRTVTIGSNVLASSILIGANDTLNAGGANDIQIQGNFTNTNIFVPSTSRLIAIGTTTSSIITTNNSNLYTVRASSTAGAVSFTEPTVTLLDNLEIATGTVTFPTTLLRVGGSFVNTGGSFAHNNAEVLFTSSIAETVQLQGTPFLNAFYDVRFDGTGDWLFTDTNATTSNTFTIDNGDVTFPTGQLTIARDFLTTAPGSFRANGGEVVFLARSSDPISTNGSVFNDIRIKTGSSLRGGDFDAAWAYRDVITISSSQIADDLSDFPVYVDMADFAAEFFDDVKADGGDIRVTQSDGVTEVPREIVAIDTGANTGEMYFKAPTLSSTTNATFYVYYANPAASEYAIDSTYGAENVWNAEYEGVYHLNETGSSYVDSTANDNDGVGEGTDPTAVAGMAGNAQSITNGRIDIGNGLTSPINLTSKMTVSTWINLNSSSGDQTLVGQYTGAGDLLFWADEGDANPSFCFYMGDYFPNDCRDTDTQNPGTWQNVVGRYNGTQGTVFVDGSITGNGNTNGSYSLDPVLRWSIGSAHGDSNARQFIGLMDEVRISSIDRTDAWLTAEYSNISTTTDFYTVVSGAGSPTRIFTDANVTATGDLVIESSSVQFPSTNFAIAGSFDNDGAFEAGAGTVTFNATTSGHTVSAGASSFRNLTFNGNNGGWNINENATATNAITLTNGNSLTVDNGVILESTGTFFNTMQNASTTWTGSTLRLSGGNDFAVNTKVSGGDTYDTLELLADTDIKLWNSSATTYITNDTSSIYSQDHLAVDGDLYIFGDYARSAGVEHWSYATDFDGTDLVGGSAQRQVDVRVAPNASIAVASTTWNIVGDVLASTTIAAQSGTFALTAVNATLTAQYFTAANTDVNGFDLSASTTVLELSNGVFTIPAGSSGITVDAATIDTNPAKQFFATDFISGGGDINVTLSDTPSSYWWFRNGVGDRYGETFDAGDTDPGSVRWDDSSYVINISGQVFADDGVTTLATPTCDGVTANVQIIVDGGAYTDTTSCDAADGSYTFTNVSYIGDPSILIYLNTNGGDRGAVVTKTPTTDITDLDIYKDRVMTRHEDALPLTIADMTAYDETNDSDISFLAATGTPDTLIVRANTELMVASSTTFAPNGNITLQSSGSGGVFDGSLHIDNGATFSSAGAQIHSIGGSFFNDESSAFIPASSTVLFTATTTGKGITKAGTSTLDFNEVQFIGVGGGWNITADVSVNEDMDIDSGTVTGTGDITVQNGQLSGNGLLSLGGGTTTIKTANTLGGTQGWTFYDLVLGDGSTVGTTTRSDVATTTVANQLKISPAHYLSAGSSIWNLSGVGEVFVEEGTLEQDTSTFVYSGAGTVDVVATNYYNLQFGSTVGTPLYTFPSLGVLVENDLLVAGTVDSVVDIDTNDPVVAVTGDVTISDSGELSLSNTTDFTISGNYTNTGTLTANSGALVFDSVDSYSISAGNSSFADVSLIGAGAAVIAENATSTGVFLIATSSDFTQQTGTTLAVGGELRVQTNNTNWTGSTLTLFGGGDYLVNAKNLTLDLESLIVAANTQIRTWNTQTNNQSVDATGSWYSQDHAGVDGDLYVYGAYVENTRADYWSFATDFDGAILATSSRQVAVYLADNASTVWTGGSISVLGTPTASTTIQNQGVGTYGITIGGNATADWRYINVRNINTSGLTFSGTPNVSDFSSADLLVESNGGSAITVGGTAITASPARTLSNIVFNSAGGVTGAINVTATGTTLSGWRFTAHSGNLDGEDLDSDPAGDPGYVIWDDSAAIISLSGNVYEADKTTVSSVCDDSTTNIVLAIKGSLVQNASSSCSSTDGSYTISGVSFGSLDELMLYIDGEVDQGAMVTKDPISSIADADIYENHVIARHENTSPLDITDMAVWDSSDDADIPYTATDAGIDTLVLPANTKLLIWGNKDFAPGGNITLAGGGAGTSYDGSLEALANATFIAANTESYSIGGSFEFAATADFISASSTVTFTSDDSGRIITINDDTFYNGAFTGSGSWSITDTNTTIFNDITISGGALTLAAGTTTVGGSLVNNSTLDTNSGALLFNAQTGAKNVTLGGSDAGAVTFAGAANWTMTDTNATTTGAFTVATGTVTLPSGVLAIAEDFIVNDTVSHNSGTVRLTKSTGDVTLTLSGNDLFSVVQTGAASTTMTDDSAALLGDLLVLGGTFNVATNTLSIGGSLDATGAVLETATGTLLFNSNDTGEFVDVGNNVLYNAVFANASGGWAVFGATTTNNFIIATASSFIFNSGETLTVGGVFQNLVGGAATTWSNTTVQLDGTNAYSINTKNSSGDSYSTLSIGSDSDIRVWNSIASSTVVASSSSLYSQDHSAINGALYVYGDFGVSTSSEYWSYATDFDGAPLTGVSQRQVNVFQAENSTTTLAEAGNLDVLGEVSFPTTVQNQGTGVYALNISGGQLDMNRYILTGLNANGLNIFGSPIITSLSNGEYNVGVEAGNAITLAQLSLNSNPSLLVVDTAFNLVSPAVTGVNVNLSATSTNSWTFRNETGAIAGEFFDVDGVTNCGSIRWSNSSCLLTEQTEYRWRNDDGGIGVPNSEWFDTDWSKRKRVRVANNDDTSYATATVKITMDYDADMQTDFEDLRFTAADGVTPINFWIEKYTAGVSADVWIQTTGLGAGDTVSAFMYYGNVAATSESSSVNTMAAADDFEDGNISEYSGQTSLFQVDAGSAYGGSFGLELNGANKGTRLNPGIARFDQTVSVGQTIRFMQYIDTAAGAADEVCTLFGVQSPATANQNYGVCLEQFGVDRVTLAKNVLSTDNFGGVTKLASSTISYTTGWYEVEVDWLTDNTINVSVYNPSGSLAAFASTTDSTYSSGGYGFTSWGQNGGWDSYTARPYMATNPTTFFGAEQVSGGASYASVQSQISSAFNPGDTARLRVAIENTGLDILAQEFTLEYAPKGIAPSCAAVSEMSYVTVPVSASCGGSAVCMSTSTVVANGAATSDLLEISRNTFSAGAFVEDPSNATNPINVNQNFYTELEYAIEVTENASDQSYCFRVTDDGTGYDSYVNVPELTLKFDPVIGAISLNQGIDISLIPGTTTAVYATGTVTDFNGATDLVLATSTIYRSGVVGGAGCTADNNNCYISNTTAGSCQFTGCSGNSCEVQCRADIFFHADPTDVGVFDGQEWLAFIEVEDASAGYDFASAIGVELTTLRAIDVSGAIDYGTLEVNADTGSFNASTSVFNLGNVEADLEVTGTDLSDGFSSLIPAEQQKFSTSTFNYGACGSSCSLLSSSTPVGLDIELVKPTVDTPPIKDDVYWGIAIPFGTNSVAHQGINVFTPVSP